MSNAANYSDNTNPKITREPIDGKSKCFDVNNENKKKRKKTHSMRYRRTEIVRKGKVSIKMRITAFQKSEMNCAVQTKREKRGIAQIKCKHITVFRVSIELIWIFNEIHNRSRHSNQMHFIDVAYAVRCASTCIIVVT